MLRNIGKLKRLAILACKRKDGFGAFGLLDKVFALSNPDFSTLKPSFKNFQTFLHYLLDNSKIIPYIKICDSFRTR